MSMTGGGHLAVLKQAFKGIGKHNLTNIAAALAYYAFLAIPSVLLVAVGDLRARRQPERCQQAGRPARERRSRFRLNS